MFLIWLVGFGAFYVYISHLHITPSFQKADGILVFTGEEGRIEAALALYQKNTQAKLHISGIFPKDFSYDPAISQDKASNTQENITQSLQWVKDNHISLLWLVTSDYHFPRVLLGMRHWPSSVKILHYPLHLNLRWSERIPRVYREYNKWLVRYVEYFIKYFF